MFDMNPFGGRKVPCTQNQVSRFTRGMAYPGLDRPDECSGALKFQIFSVGLQTLDVFSWRPYSSFPFGHLRPYTSIYVHIRPFTTIYDHLRPFTTIYDHLQPFTTIYNHLQPFTTIYDHIRPYIGLFTTIYVHLRPFTSISVGH